MWYLVLSQPVGAREQLAAQRDNHLAWMKTQHESGHVLFSGPTANRSHGIYVIRADSHESAQSIADTDPFHAQGLRQYEILDWEVHQIMGAGPFSSAEIERRN